MGHKKNELKSKINRCFFCSKELKSLKDKIIHRINQKKNISENNIIILCSKCKYKFSLGGLKIYKENISKENLKSYFLNLEKDYKEIILKAIQYQRDKNENKKNLF